MDLCIVSMSGGIDSTTVACEALERGFDLVIVNFEYGQKHRVELEAFNQIYQWIQRKYNKNIPVHKINLKPLLDNFINIWQQMRDSKEILTSTSHQYYTPSRNLLFIVLSSVVGEIIGLAKNYKKIFIGLGIHQHSKEAYGESKDYWDITPMFYNAVNNVLKLNDVRQLRLFAPFVDMYKADIIKRAIELEVPYRKTWTCYNPIEEKNNSKITYRPCNECEACKERALAGKQAGIVDINNYEIIVEQKYQ